MKLSEIELNLNYFCDKLQQVSNSSEIFLGTFWNFGFNACCRQNNAAFKSQEVSNFPDNF